MRLILHTALLATALAALPAVVQAQDRGATDGSAAQSVEVTLSNFKFTPKDLRLHHGQTYRLHLVNSGSGGHDFSAPEFFAASEIAPADAAMVRDGRIEVAKGETRDIRITPRTPGDYKVECTHMMHAMLGMKGRITVD